MKKWCVRDPMCGVVTIVEATSGTSAAERGAEQLAEEFPDATTCGHCATVTLAEVEVWPLEVKLVRRFEVEKRWVSKS